MSTPAARSRMKKIMQLTLPLPAKESYPDTALPENIQQNTESLVLDSYLLTGNNNDIDMESILSSATSPSIIDFISDTDLNSEQNTIPTNARSNPKSYVVNILNYGDFVDWKSYSQALLPAKFKINFNSLRVVHFHKTNPVILFKYGFSENCEINALNMDFVNRSRANNAILLKGPIPLYHNELSISAAKYKDLKELCNKNVIPNRYHEEYLSMRHNKTIRDTLAETDEDDSDKEN